MADLFRTPATYGFNAADDVYPGYPGIVVREHEGARVLQSMNWGFPVRLKNMKPTSKPKPVNNARDDKLLTPFWKHWFITPAQRCLIPFTAFAEAEGPKGKMTRTWIRAEDQPTAAWAGLWRPSDEWGDCYTGVMVDATDELFDIHDRMPVILHPEEHDTLAERRRRGRNRAGAQIPGKQADRLSHGGAVVQAPRQGARDADANLEGSPCLHMKSAVPTLMVTGLSSKSKVTMKSQ